MSSGAYRINIKEEIVQANINKPAPIRVFVENSANRGTPGVGIPTGGTTNQILRKRSNTNYDTEWHTETTDDVSEGSTNLYYTSGRVDAKISTHNSDANSHPSILNTLALKANTTDVNAALALKANQSTTYTKTEVDNALILKADQTSLDTTNNNVSTNTTNITNIQEFDILTDNYKKSILSNKLVNNSLVFPTATGTRTDGIAYANPLSIQNGGYDLVVKGLTLTNLISNGNFANGTTGWTAYGGTGSVTNGIYSIVGAGAGAWVFTKKTTSYPCSPTKQIYLFARARVRNAGVLKLYTEIVGSTSGVVTGAMVSNPVQDQWYPLYAIKDTSILVGNVVYSIAIQCADAASSNGVTMEINYANSFDLTASALSTLTADQVNKLAPGYVDGTQSVVNPTVRNVGKNLIPMILDTRTTNGLTITNNSDGSITVNGTATSNSNFRLYDITKFLLNAPNNNYTLSLNANQNNNLVMVLADTSSPSSWVTLCTTSSGIGKYTGTIQNGGCYIVYTSGTTYSNVIIKPMIEPGSTATAYEPFVSNDTLIQTTLRSVADSFSVTNMTSYDPTTWNGWTKDAGIVGDATGLEWTTNGSNQAAVLNCAFKSNTKYGYLVNCITNTLASSQFNTTSGLTGSAITFISKGVTGNVKGIFTTQATITSNSLYLYSSLNEPVGHIIKIKDIRVFELPVGSEIESDFNTKTADELVAKYPFVNGSETIISSNRLQDKLYNSLGIWKVDRIVNPSTGAKQNVATETITVTGNPFAYAGGTTQVLNTVVTPTVECQYLLNPFETMHDTVGKDGYIPVLQNGIPTWGNTITANNKDVPALIIKGVASQTANLQEWKDSTGANKAYLTKDGINYLSGIANIATANNSQLLLGTTGTVISRNIADGSTAMIVNQSNSSSTGKIADFQFAGVSKAYVDKDGKIYTNSKEVSIKDDINILDDYTSNLISDVVEENLYKGSAEWTGTWASGATWQDTAETLNGFKVKTKNGTWSGLFKLINIVAGKTYTFTAWAKVSVTQNVAIMLNQSLSGYATTATVTYGTNQFNVNANTWTKMTLTFQCTVSGTIAPRIENTSTANLYIAKYKLVEGTESFELSEVIDDVDELKSLNVQNIKTDVSNIAIPNINLLETATKTANKVYNRGTQTSSDNVNASIYALIPITIGQTYYYRMLYAYFTTIKYDSGTLLSLSNTTESNAYGSFTAAENGTIAITVSNARSGYIFTTSQDMYNKSIVNSYYTPNKLVVPKVYHVEKNGTGDFTKLTDAITEACKYMDSIIYVGTGTWDIITELGSAYIETISESNRGIYLKNRVHLIFASNSEVICNYTGGNTTVQEWLSIFNAGIYGFTLENAVLKGSNIRYTMHDERDSDTDQYINKYINCKMYLDNSAINGHRQCIGGGLGLNGYIEINGCYFETVGTNVMGISYHNSAGANAKSHIAMKNSYVTGTNTCGFKWYGQSDLITNVEINNCSLGSAIVYRAETTDGTSPIQNVEILEWNNIIRS